MNGSPAVSHSHTYRSRFTATLTIGGSKPACITQLASIPVARCPVPTVRI
jgi:hypothetical protein